MTIAAVMVYVEPTQQAEEQVAVARSIASKFGAAIIGVSAWAIEPTFVSGGVVISDTTPQDIMLMKATLAQKAEWFREVVGFPKERVEWRWAIEHPNVFLANEARSADLIVVRNPQQRVDPYRIADPADMVLRLGRPTILAPEHLHDLHADQIMIGWKDTREARLAVHNALPFLKAASQVTIAEICTSTEQDAARHRVRDVARYLQLHGVKSETEVRVHMVETDASHLIRMAKERGADLIVSGAYGHSRLGEWIFGGMTRTLIQESPFCLMMSH
ncbi:universal stress protein [Labrys sp. ZIDIC5]|uniref:universal stress protein n=1 Tax=Labrys sedimenti TaxID=3106036 RepID=UPI002ACADB4D|nr:universal stress protein [Labrys sp. ZIDIC5]MDZ5454453.1 universal stress protein [Labrys sp. ZIDIC5]